jgi:SAM-dependent methyltransferase
MSDDIDACLEGRKLYGDDFSPQELASWYADEEEGFFELWRKGPERRPYGAYALNAYHGLRHLRGMSFEHVLGIGSSYGDELLPLAPRTGRFTILEPSSVYRSGLLGGRPVNYVKPEISGLLPFSDASFDLLVCFSALHHIPNVSTVVKECSRCLKPGARALIREPAVSMGDWRRPRRGLTKNERGIPAALFGDIVTKAGFRIIRASHCSFSLLPRLQPMFAKPVYNYRSMVVIDHLLSRLFSWNDCYHPTNIFQKIRPVAMFYVLEKSA